MGAACSARRAFIGLGSNLGDREANLERDTLHMIIERIMDKKADLYWYYTHVGDPSGGGVSATGSSVVGLERTEIRRCTARCTDDPGAQTEYVAGGALLTGWTGSCQMPGITNTTLFTITTRAS